MDNVQKAYLAGFLDADGCISVSRQKRNKTNDRYYYQGQITLVNSNREVLEVLKEWCGFGKIHECKPQKSNWKITYHLRLNFQKGAELLKQIIPYLIIKQPQANLYIILHGLKKGNVGKHDLAYTDIMKEYAKIHYQMKMLNKRGV